ncbi:unnamed protein product, partial [Brassica oleracea var. botrytis]
ELLSFGFKRVFEHCEEYSRPYLLVFEFTSRIRYLFEDQTLDLSEPSFRTLSAFRCLILKFSPKTKEKDINHVAP